MALVVGVVDAAQLDDFERTLRVNILLDVLAKFGVSFPSNLVFRVEFTEFGAIGECEFVLEELLNRGNSLLAVDDFETEVVTVEDDLPDNDRRNVELANEAVD